MAKVESDEKILFNLLKQQKDIEATIIKAIETIVAQKRTIKLSSYCPRIFLINFNHLEVFRRFLLSKNSLEV